jgi:hypothetical protein
MLVITLITGDRCRKEPSDSSASATSRRPVPSAAAEPSTLSLPPTITVGSRPAVRSTVATSEVVVVLPCVPAMAMPSCRRISSASISARRMTGMPRARARRISGLSGAIAEENTTTSALATWPASWPMCTVAPRLCRRRVISLAAASEPLTAKPCARSTSAMPLMPMPPMPTK